MTHQGTSPAGLQTHTDYRAREASIPELFAEVYVSAPAVERGRLLEQLMRPLGVLSLFGIAGGIFANIRFRSGWKEIGVRLEDIQNVHASEVIALVDHAQQVSVETVDGLAQLLTASPLLSGSAAAALLVTLLLHRARSREAGVSRTDTPGPRPV
jgi:hypothetical protein